MIIYIFWLAFGLTSSHLTCIAYHCETAVAVKQNLPETPLTGIGSRTFLELAKTSSAFVDKSLFIVEMLSNTSSTVVIISPKKTGKTMNLDMLKTFVSLQVDSQGYEIPPEQTVSYQLFMKGEIHQHNGSIEYLEKPLLISAPEYKELVDKYLARFPVVHVDFKNTVGYNFTEVVARMLTSVCRAYQQHPYMIEVLKKNGTAEELQKFKLMFDEDPSLGPDHVMYGVQTLSHLLKKYFNKSVFVFLDNYDVPLQNLYQEHYDYRKKEKVLDLFDGFVEYTMRNNIYSQRGVVTGTFRFSDYFFSGWLNWHIYNIPYKPEPMVAFFGLNQNDVRTLFELHQITQELAYEAHNWYYAYYVASSRQHFYNSWSILNFLKERTVHSYWKDEGENLLIDKMIRLSYPYRLELLTLLNKRKLKVTRGITFTEDNFEFIQSLLQRKGNPSNYNPFYTYLISKGYLSVQPVNNKIEHAFLPNNEIFYEISQRMASYYKWFYQLDQVHVYTAASNLHAFIDDENLSSKSLEHSLQILCKSHKQQTLPPIREHRLIRIRRFFDGLRRERGIVCTHPEYGDVWGHESPEFDYDDEEPVTVDESVEEILNCVAMEMHRIAKFRIEIFYQRELQANIVTFNPDTNYGTAIEIRHTSKLVDTILDNITDYKQVLQHFLNVQTIKFIVIKVSRKLDVTVSAKIIKTSILRKI